MISLKDFHYDLPKELIAQRPLEERDRCRLMVIDRQKSRITHDVFANIGQYLPQGSTIVLNDSKVIPARLLGNRATGGTVEVLLLRRLSDGYSYECLIKPLGRLKLEEKIIFNGSAVYAELKDHQKKIVRFNKKNIGSFLNRIGHMPLPPYIKRTDEPKDREFYQTVYARKEGSVAAPTAGLHFTPELLERLQKDGHRIEKVTLHVNYATFKIVEEEDITKHQMYFEDYAVSAKTMKALGPRRLSRLGGTVGPIVAVGTTSCRVLETLVRTQQSQGSTNIFIYPGLKFQRTDVLITNFHLPKSTLLMLVYAFGGTELMKRAYQEAIEQRYRFYSYGDAMVIL